MPVFPQGTQVEVTGKWDKKAAAWRAGELCVTALPAKSIRGQAVIDAVTGAAPDFTLTADGRQLHEALAPRTHLTLAPPLTAGSTLRPGQWLRYTADLHPDGSWVLRDATVQEALDNRAARNERKWKPLSFTAPTPGHEGAIKLYRLSSSIKLPSDPELQTRVARVGASVVPARENPSTAAFAREGRFHFYAAKLHGADCMPLADGTILVPESTAKALPNDGELAAVLGGCVAALEEEQAAQIANKQLIGNSLEAASIVAISPAGLVATLAYDEHMHHIQLLQEEQSARVALSYLQNAGYPASAGPAAWEKLESKHGQAGPSRPPGPRTQLMYQALTEHAAAAETGAQTARSSR